ncbi:MAG: NADH-quinone oxidoreductase subunit 5 family protein [Candidatus Kariarchaeaceae archaeon]|jgi:NADH-quinone oxidoreductase subunit L
MAGSGLELIEDQALISAAVAVIVIPFITGLILLAMRGFEIKRSLTTGTTFKFNENLTGGIGVAGLFGSLISSLIVTFQYFGLQDFSDLKKLNLIWVQGDYDFLPTSSAPFKFGIVLSPLSVLMMLLLAIIAFAIHLYATEYMHADSAYTRFFGTLNFFTASMFGFVLASNLFMAFVFWELLGFASYLLIGYYWPKRSASSAAKKAFLYNKVGDVSFMVGIALLWSLTANHIDSNVYATLDYFYLKEFVSNGFLDLTEVFIPGLLIFGGAVGKSAQVPLLGWLPEAMEGPTPVSALLHSSTMVKAGLFLTARVFFTFYEIDADLHVKLLEDFALTANVIAWVGTLTALAGGLMALTATDIKRVLAFSTISQLGYIGLALGAGGLTPAFFHLISHATFKSLLFLCAGAVIHSVHSQEMDDMGGLHKYMPHTSITMGIGLIALAGFPPMNGFFSKDAILLAMEESDIVGHQFLFWIAILTAGITAFYSTKLYIKIFRGEPRYDKDHVHPAPSTIRMRISLYLLAGFVVLQSLYFLISIGFGAGGFNSGGSKKNFEYFLGSLLGQHGGDFDWVFAIPSILAVVIGIGLSYVMYEKGGLKGLQSNPVSDAVYTAAENRFGLDMAIYAIAEGPVMKIGDAFQSVDKDFIDGRIVDGLFTQGTLNIATASDQLDINVVDGFVNFLGGITKSAGLWLRKLQTGQTPNYAMIMAFGLGVILSIYSIGTFII